MSAFSWLPDLKLNGRKNRVSDYIPDVPEKLSNVAAAAQEKFSDLRDHVADIDDTEFARGLGWASIAIGLTELLATKQVQSMLGLEDTPDRRGTIRVLGVREVMHGVSILTEEKPTQQMAASVWGRVAGDVLDSALLGIAATKTKKPFSFAAVTLNVLAIGLADLLCAKRLSK